MNYTGGPLSVKCRHNYYLAGVQSDYDSGRNDRSFAFWCCHNWGQCYKNCRKEGPVNNSGGLLGYRVKNNEFIVGASSTYSNHKRYN